MTSSGNNEGNSNSVAKSSSKPDDNNKNSNNNTSKIEQYNALMQQMSKTKESIDEETGDASTGADDHDRLLSQAIDMAIQQGRGWSPGEKEAYLETILDDDFIPPMFATTPEEMEKTGLQDAFTSLIYDGESPTSLLLQFKKKGQDAFLNGKRNEAGNLQYFREAINHYAEALAWALKVEPLQPGDLAVADTDDPTFTEHELDVERAKICCNLSLMHAQLKNWGYSRDHAQQALEYDKANVKAWFRLAKAQERLKCYEDAGNALDAGLKVDPNNADLQKLHKQLDQHIRQARKLRQQRERARAERVSKVKGVWKHCQERSIQLGRTSLVSSVTDDEEDDDNGQQESKWHQHLPMSGVLPSSSSGKWSWPCLFLYPSHQQSDFIKNFDEDELLAVRMAQMFPELEEGEQTTEMPWDNNQEFQCSNLAVYFEVLVTSGTNKTKAKEVIHPDSVELLQDQGACMRFYESSRALKGDEGPEMANVVRAAERKHLYQQRKRWIQQHGSLWSRPNPSDIVRVHPGVTLEQILEDKRLVVPNFIVTLLLFPENHPAHEAFLKEHKCIDILQPKEE